MNFRLNAVCEIATANSRNVPTASQSTAPLRRGGSGRFGVWAIKTLRPGLAETPTNYSGLQHSGRFSPPYPLPVDCSLACLATKGSLRTGPFVTKVAARQTLCARQNPQKPGKTTMTTTYASILLVSRQGTSTKVTGAVIHLR